MIAVIPRFARICTHSRPEEDEMACCENQLWSVVDDWVRGDAPEPWNEPGLDVTFMYEPNGRSFSLTPIEEI